MSFEGRLKKSVGLISKKKTICTCSTLSKLYISLPLFCTTTTRNFQKLPSYMFYVFLLTCFRCRSFSPWWSRACFSSDEIGLLCFLPRSSSFLVIHVNVDIKIKLKYRIGFVVVVFISKTQRNYAIYRNNARVLEMQNFIPSYMRGWTYVRTYSVRTLFSEPKFPVDVEINVFELFQDLCFQISSCFCAWLVVWMAFSISLLYRYMT